MACPFQSTTTAELRSSRVLKLRVARLIGVACSEPSLSVVAVVGVDA
jgi:hypothetical protein